MELSAAAAAVRLCPVFDEAVGLAESFGDGALAGTERERAASRPWMFGIGAGLIRVANGKATMADGLDLAAMEDAELLDRWLTGARAVCEAETPEHAADGVLLLVLGVLDVIGKGGLPAAELIRAVAASQPEIRDRVAAAWLAAREPAAAARELRTAASAMPAPARLAALTALGVKLSDDPGGLLLEYVAAKIAEGGVDEALTMLWCSLPGHDIEAVLSEASAADHPDAAAVVDAVRKFAESGAPLGIDQAMELTVTLTGAVAETWRTVRLPATASLVHLHDVIQSLFSWYDWREDRTFVFTVGQRQYGDGDALSLGRGTTSVEKVYSAAALFRASGRIGYVSDLDARWEHEIRLDRTLPRDRDDWGIRCLAYAGDSPSGYPGAADGTVPFDIDEVNQRFAHFGDDIIGRW